MGSKCLSVQVTFRSEKFLGQPNEDEFNPVLQS